MSTGKKALAPFALKIVAGLLTNKIPQCAVAGPLLHSLANIRLWIPLFANYSSVGSGHLVQVSGMDITKIDIYF
jgi:hypothetical protein